jgi:hypothetical protein
LLAALLLPLDIGVRRIALPVGEILSKVWGRLRTLRAERVPDAQVATVGRLQQAKQRAKTDTGPATSLIPPSRTEAPKEPVAPRQVPTGSAGSSASKLLEAKKKRGEKD